MPRERASERACDNAIKQTLAYRATFKYPLSFHQLCTFLLASKAFKYELFTKELNKLVKREHIGFKDGKYFLSGVKPVSWEARVKKTAEIYQEATKALHILNTIPWVKLIAITGSVAAYNADKNSDIDIFIITEKNRLWITRSFVSVLLKITKVYVSRDGEPGKICPNLFIDESQLEWPKDKQNVYTAHEIAIMQPVLNRDNTYFKFLKANEWIKKYFPNYGINTNVKGSKKKNNSNLLSRVERFSHLAQLVYMRKKKTIEITDPHFAHFRKHDNSDQILEDFHKTLKTHVQKEHFHQKKIS